MANLKHGKFVDTWPSGKPDRVVHVVSRVKVILLGNSNVGKTSLVTRYVKNKFHPCLQQTIGAAFWVKNVEVKGKLVKLNIWDTAGDERYRSIVSLYYRDAKAALVCFDLTNRKSWGDVTYWIKELVDKEGSCKIYLVGTKKDLAHVTETRPSTSVVCEEEIRCFIARHQPVMTGCYTTSSLNGHGVETLFEDVANASYDVTISEGIEKPTVVLPPSTNVNEKTGGCSCH